MIKKNKITLTVASILILLPALFGVAVWNRLPENMAIHWGIGSVADGFAPRFLAVFLMPLIFIALFWAGVFVTAWDQKKSPQNSKVTALALWIMPLVSLWVNGMLYATAFGLAFDMRVFVCALLGIVFLITGNFLPKCRRNRTIGIKIKWTLANDENWNATHRFGGRMWVLCGLLMLICAFFPTLVFPWCLILVILLAIVPVAIYSNVYAKMQIREGRAKAEDFRPRGGKVQTVIGIVLTVLLLCFVGVVLFTGNVEILYHDMSLEAEADYYGDLHLSYDAIKGVEYREDFQKGSRVAGFGTPRLSLGSFQNDELGTYTLYSYTGCDDAVLLRVEGDRVIVLSGKDEAATKVIYEEILKRVKAS